MKLKNLIAGACALCGFAVSAAELPAGYTQVASVQTDGAQFVNLNYTWQANSSATNGEPAAGLARNVGGEMRGERSNLSAVWTYSV